MFLGFVLEYELMLRSNDLYNILLIILINIIIIINIITILYYYHIIWGCLKLMIYELIIIIV